MYKSGLVEVYLWYCLGISVNSYIHISRIVYPYPQYSPYIRIAQRGYILVPHPVYPPVPLPPSQKDHLYVTMGYDNSGVLKVLILPVFRGKIHIVCTPCAYEGAHFI